MKTNKKKDWNNLTLGLCPACSRKLERSVKKIDIYIDVKKPMFGDGGMLEIITCQRFKKKSLSDQMVCLCDFKIITKRYNEYVYKHKNIKSK